jgi:predicted permease
VRARQKLRLRLRSLFFRGRVDREIETELRFHLVQLTEENVAAGMPEEQARRMARLTIGNVTHFQEECRDMRRVNYIDDLLRDLRYAGRNLGRNPGFAALAVLIMALGIGANTAVFSVVNAVLLKPLAYSHPDRIVTLSDFSTLHEASTALSRQVSIPNVLDWQSQNSSFEAMAYYGSREGPVVGPSTAEYARLTLVSPGFLKVFAVEPVIGRFFTPDEMKPESGGAVMISYAYWQTHFGGDPAALGKKIRVYGLRPIVGVLPPGFGFPASTDLWVSWTLLPQPRTAQNWLALGRLKPGISLDRAQSEMSAIARHLEQQYPASNQGRTVIVRRMQDDMTGDVRPTLYSLLGTVGVVLLIACANTATLLLGKATARTREVAVRAALGASRHRLMRQLAAESLLLAILAGASGLALAWWGSKALVRLAPAEIPRLMDTGIDRWVLAFTFGLSIITSLLFGLVPALYASKVVLNDALKQGAARIVSGRGVVRMRGVLVVVEIALAVVLVSAAGLLIKSFVALQNVPLGFRPENVLVMRATVPAPPATAFVRARQFFRTVISRAAALPGVAAAGATMAPPGNVDSTGFYFIDTLPPPPEPPAPAVVLSIVAPGTFSALGIPLKAGRDFSDSDTLDRPFVAVVNEALVRKSFVHQNPLGRTIFCPFDSPQGMTIIGVVGDVRQRGPEREPMPECYMTYEQHLFNGPDLSVVVRTAGDPNALGETLRRIAHESNPEAPMKFTTMEALTAGNVAAPRFRTLLFAAFGALAVCLAIAGIYGVMAYSVTQRSYEVGLRIALGAGQGGVVWLILRQGMALAAIGLNLGLAASIAGTRLLKSMLFQVRPNDPWVYVSVAVMVAVVTLAAGYIPASRAARIDPTRTLRE